MMRHFFQFAKISSVNVLNFLAANLNLPFFQLDVKNTFFMENYMRKFIWNNRFFRYFASMYQCTQKILQIYTGDDSRVIARLKQFLQQDFIQRIWENSNIFWWLKLLNLGSVAINLRKIKYVFAYLFCQKTWVFDLADCLSGLLKFQQILIRNYKKFYNFYP